MDINTLKKFCANGIDRINIQAPWSKGEHSYATNGHVIIRVPRLAEVPENDKAPLAEKIFTVGAPAEWFPLSGIKLPKIKTMVCECDDNGMVYHEDCSDCSGHKCEECGGTREITVGEDKPVAIGKAFFQNKYLRLLKGLPNCKISPGADAESIAVFEFDGGDGLIMEVRVFGEGREP